MHTYKLDWLPTMISVLGLIEVIATAMVHMHTCNPCMMMLRHHAPLLYCCLYAPAMGQTMPTSLVHPCRNTARLNSVLYTPIVMSWVKEWKNKPCTSAMSS